jgi:drug/metabolite transporter (DMT)-like permease
LPEPQNSKNRFAGIILIIISAAAFGTLGILGRYAYAEGLDTLSIMALRFLLSALVLLAMLALRGEALPRGRNLVRLIGMGAVGYVGQAFAYLTALKYASPGLVALLLYLYPVFVVILSVIWNHEPINRIKIFALGVALIGLALTVGPAGGQLPGILLAICAAAIYSVYIIVGTKVMQEVSAIQSSTVIFFSAGVTSSLLMFANGAHLPKTGTGWAVIAAIVLIATVIPVVTFLAGLRRIGATNAAMLSTLEPVVTVLLAALLLGEILKPVTLVGGGLILAAVIILMRTELRGPANERVDGGHS